MEYLNIYLNAFKNFKDYHTPAPRKELNFFILFYFIFWLIIFIPMMVVGFYHAMSSMMEDNFDYLKLLIPFGVVGWVFYLVHIVPLLALIKRRLIDIFSQKAGLIFWIYATIEIIRLLISLVYPFAVYFLQNIVMTSENLPVANLVVIWIIGLINNALSFLVLAFYIFLMVKQGNIGKEEK